MDDQFPFAWLEHPRPDRGLRILADDGSWRLVRYTDFALEVLALAGYLRTLGVRSRQRVAVLTPAPEEFLAAFYALQVLGATAVALPPPIPLQAHGGYLAHVTAILNDISAHHLLIRGVAPEAVARLPGAVGHTLPWPDRLPKAGKPLVYLRSPLPLIQYTSGSTSAPRGVKVPQASLGASLRQISQWLSISPDDSGAFWIPHYHDMGLVAMLAGIANQGDVWLMRPDQFVRNPFAWLRCFGEYGCTITTAPTFGYRLVLRHAARRRVPWRLDRWRAAIVGAERVEPLVLAEFCAVFGPQGFRPEAFLPAYGLAEATLAVTGTPLDAPAAAVLLDGQGLDIGRRPVPRRERSVDAVDLTEFDQPGWLVAAGHPLNGVAVETRDDVGRPLLPGSVGEIWVRSPALGSGYWRTRSTERFTADGLRTGDVGFLYNGQLYVLGRVADRLKVHGVNLYAEDLEERLERRTGARAGSLLVLPDLHGSEQVLTVVWERRRSAAKGLTVENIAAAAQNLVGPHVTVHVYPVSPGGIPRTTSGKPRRFAAWRALRALGSATARA